MQNSMSKLDTHTRIHFHNHKKNIFINSTIFHLNMPIKSNLTYALGTSAATSGGSCKELPISSSKFKSFPTESVGPALRLRMLPLMSYLDEVLHGNPLEVNRLHVHSCSEEIVKIKALSQVTCDKFLGCASAPLFSAVLTWIYRDLHRQGTWSRSA